MSRKDVTYRRTTMFLKTINSTTRSAFGWSRPLIWGLAAFKGLGYTSLSERGAYIQGAASAGAALIVEGSLRYFGDDRAERVCESLSEAANSLEDSEVESEVSRILLAKGYTQVEVSLFLSGLKTKPAAQPAAQPQQQAANS